MSGYKVVPVKRCAACGNEKPVSEMKTCMHNQMHRYVCDSKCMNDFYNPPNNPRPDAASPAVQGESVGEVRFELGSPSVIYAELYSETLPSLAPGAKLYTAPQLAPSTPAPTFQLGDHVRKTKGSQWEGRVVGTYSTSLTPEGYAVESDTEKGSVQIYPVGALELVAAHRKQEST